MQERKDVPPASQNGSSFITDTVKQIKKTLQGDILSVEEIRQSLSEDRQDEMNFIDLLKKHHDFLEESISVLTDKNAEVVDKQFHLDRFIKLLDMHGMAEQETLYIALKDNEKKEARLEGFGGQDEHDVAFQVSDELIGMNFAEDWTEEVDAKAKVVANMVKNHIKEEESMMFSIAKSDISEEQLNALTDSYIDKCLTQLTTFSMNLSDNFDLPRH